jgi:type IV pilus assembly protein PilO
MTTTSRFFGLELDRRGISVLVGVGGMLVVGLVAFNITLPQFNRIQELDAQISQKQQEVDTKKSQLAQLPALLAERERSGQLLRAVTSLIPTADKLPSLLIDTTRLVKASNADLRKFTPGELKAIPELNGAVNIQSTSAKVSLTASFGETLALMRNIERLEQLLRIENISLKPVETKTPAPGAAPATQRLVAEFDLTAYMLGDNAPAPAPSPAK